MRTGHYSILSYVSGSDLCSDKIQLLNTQQLEQKEAAVNQRQKTPKNSDYLTLTAARATSSKRNRKTADDIQRRVAQQGYGRDAKMEKMKKAKEQAEDDRQGV
jgi:hypothetical protein